MKTKLLSLLALATCSLTATAQPQPQGLDKRMMWASINTVTNASLGSYQQHTGKLLISWRMLPTDTWDTSFHLYSRLAAALNGSLTRVTSSKPVANATCYQTSSVPTSPRVYYLVPGNYFSGLAPSTVSDMEGKQAIREAALDSLLVEKDTRLLQSH